METTTEASTTRVDVSVPPSSGNVVDDEPDKIQATTPDPRWPYLNRWSSNVFHEASVLAALELVSPHPPTVVEAESGASLTETGENDGVQLDDLKKVAPLADSGAPPTASTAPPTASTAPPSLTQDQESSPVAAVHDSSVAAIHDSSLITAVHDSLVAAVNDITVDKVPEPARSDLNGEDDKAELNEDEDTTQKNAFVQSLGAWSKPLHFAPPPPRLGVSEAIKCQIDSFWPTIGEAIVKGPKTKRGQMLFPEQTKPQLPTIPPPALKEDGSLRFPWAARMNQSSRNLFRATEPTYRPDGTPQVTIPAKVLRLGPENKEEYVVGQFHRCSNPPGGLIHAVLNRLWGRECMISCRKLGDSSYLFHIPHENTRKWVIQRGVWHVDDCLLFVAPWNPVDSFKTPEISTLPVWVTLKNIPNSCFSRLGISHIASGLGEPMLTHKPRLDPINMGEAKILVEVELDKPFPKLIALDDKQGNIYLVEVEYSWIPSACERCGALGHKEKRCLLPPQPQDFAPTTKEPQVTNEEIPTVDIVKLLQNSSTPRVDHPDSRSPIAQQTLDTFKKPLVTLPPEDAFASPITHSHEVHSVPCSLIDNTLPLLAAEKAAPTQSHIMENIPSHSITLEVSEAPKSEQPIDPRSPLTLDHHRFHTEETPPAYGKGSGFDVVGDSSSYTITRGGRTIKPTQKVQDMGWTKVSGRGKRGRRGRGNQNH